jgi:hypothetical protein
MISAILWKEYREQRSAWLTLAVVGAAALVGLPLTMEPGAFTYRSELRESLKVVTLVLGWTYGLVCGAILLAGEREAGTEGFLDTLPASRLGLWRAKLLAGLVFVLAQVILLAALALAMGVPEDREVLLGLGLLLACALFGLGWGLFLSARAKNVLNAIGQAIFWQALASPLVTIAFALLMGVLLFLVQFAGLPIHGDHLTVVTVVLSATTLIAGPMVLSGWIHSRTDRLRRPLSALPGLRPPGSRSSSSFGGWLVLLGLARRQGRPLALVLVPVALVAGFLLPIRGLVLWPAFTLFLGCLCGVTTFTDEQQSGAFRFLGDQRFPPGRIWLVKVGLRLALAVAACLCMLVPGSVMAAVGLLGELHPRRQGPAARVFGSPLLSGPVPVGVFLCLWVLHGFAAGVLCGQLFRRGLVAMVMALGMAMPLAAAWVPSLPAGGLYLWQVLGVPVLLLGASRLLMRRWLADRLATPAVVCRVVVAVLLAIGWVAGGLAYRVVEIPDVPEPAALAEYEEWLPTPEENQAGSLIRSACLRANDQFRAAAALAPIRRLFPDDKEVPHSFHVHLDEVLQRGWPPGKPELGDVLDAVFKDEWPAKLNQAAQEPLGLVEDPRRISLASHERAIDPARTTGMLLAVRGLQCQAQGDPEVMLGHLESGLALARNLGHRSTVLSALAGRSVETNLLRALDRWLEQLDGRPDLLRPALATLKRHRREIPERFGEQKMAEYLRLRNSLDDPTEWLELHGEFLFRHGQSGELDRGYLAMVRVTPWEAARQERILRAVSWGNDPASLPRSVQRGRTLVPLFPDGEQHLLRHLLRHRARREAALLKLALRLYQAEKGAPAERLGQLVPVYLAEVPRDPFDGKPFRYRLSRGEEIPWPADRPPGGPRAPQPVLAPGGILAQIPPPPPPPTRNVPAGQGILWSVGEDGVDDGGKRQDPVPERQQTRPGEDIIFLVPLPPRRP